MMSQEVLHVVHEKDPWIIEEDVTTHTNDKKHWIVEEQTAVADKKGRRKSWHAIKFEKKRRKGVVDESGLANVRQKRPSWWNIFAAQPWPRSRRASQDVERITRSNESLPYVRSKSRSVDHGVSTTFDLEALRIKEKVDSRLERDFDGSNSSLAEKKRGPPENTTLYTVANRDTLTSVAAGFDTTPSELATLNKLGTSFIFPGQQLYVPLRAEKELKDTIPQGDSHDDLPLEEKELLDNLRPVSPKPGHAERVRTPSYNQASIPEQDEESSSYSERFLKINVRHITDGQGVVSGVLLVTPNAVMFDPNVSDPLVIEHGPEAYGVIAPMEFVVNVAIYHDIAHMRVGHIDGSKGEKPEIYYAKPHCKMTDDHEPDSLMVKDETFPELVTDDAESVCSSTEREGDAFPKAFERELVTPTNLDCLENIHNEERRKSLIDQHWAIPSRDRQSVDVDDDSSNLSNLALDDNAESEDESLIRQSCHDSGIDITETVPPPPPPPPVPTVPTKKKYSDADIILSNDWVPPITIAPTQVTPSESDSPSRKKTSSVSFSLDSTSTDLVTSSSLSTSVPDGKDMETRKNKMLKRLSYPLAWMETFTGEKEEEKSSQPNSADSHHSSMFSKVFSRRSSVGTFMRQPTDSAKPPKVPPPKLDYRSMVSMDDMPELFVSFDKLIPRPARSCDDPPLYLRLRMGKPIDKPIPRSTPLMSYGKKKMRPEYWFSVPRNRIDDLYSFIQVWFPQLYGELDEEQVQQRGFSLVELDTELWSNDATPSGSRHGSQDGEITELTKESWEVLPMSEELRQALYSSVAPSLDIDIAPPELVGNTEILTDLHRESLCRHLPARAEGYLWSLVFSTSQHGFSLNSMYRKMSKLESPILLVIEDTDNNVFGALTSCALQVSDHFYGTGESLLFRFSPHFQVYNWTGENLYFIKGNNESLSIGAGDGKFGLWLDGDLYQGRSESCQTYGNDPLTPKVDFVVKTLECWAFV